MLSLEASSSLTVHVDMLCFTEYYMRKGRLSEPETDRKGKMRRWEGLLFG